MKDQTYLDRESNLTPGISKISAKNVNVYYDDVQALKDVSVEIEKNAVLVMALIASLFFLLVDLLLSSVVEFLLDIGS